MDIQKLKSDLGPKLGPLFKYDICHVNNLSEPVLIILDYSLGEDRALASFAFSLEEYEKSKFPSKCWCTFKEMETISEECPSPNDSYNQFRYNEAMFYPFSANLSEFSPAEPHSLQQLVCRLYKHIKFE